ncbi:MAG: prepilin-type N-terminal cleavage/methylation domain-containing protein [Pseudobdellovibrionaceae bacterium]
MHKIKSFNNRGFTFLELLITVGILAVAVLAIGTVHLQLSKQQAQSASLFQVDIFNKNLATLVRTQASWRASVNAEINKDSMECLRVRTIPCTVDGTPMGAPLKDIPFAIFDGAGNLFFNGMDHRAGISMWGDICNSYTNDGADECPFRPQLTWTAACVQGSCINPQVQVNATLKYSSRKVNLIVNTTNHSMPNIYRSAY